MQELFGVTRLFFGCESGGIDIQKGKTVVGKRFGGRWQLDAVPKATCGGRIQSDIWRQERAAPHTGGQVNDLWTCVLRCRGISQISVSRPSR